jgi:hypothetical protein
MFSSIEDYTATDPTMDATDDCCTLIVTGRPQRIPSVRKIDPLRFTTCYLCNETISGGSSRDHVPPKQFFPKVFRKANATDHLEWLPTHLRCNKSYQRDEDYFVTTFGLPAAAITGSGHALGHDIRARYRGGEQKGLVNKVLEEFVSGSNQKGFDSGRTNRVAWKIVRGLHCLRTGEVLPERGCIAGGFDCAKTQQLLGAVDAAMLASGFNDPWEGTLPMIFKVKIMVDEHHERQTYSYLLVCWDYLTYFLTFSVRNGSILAS